jgi:hypothetical protein
MGCRVLITVDTELTGRHHGTGGWRENFDRSVEPAGVGLSHQLERLGRHGLKACFFVDPMPALVYGLDPVRRMVEPILAAGQEVQLHLHSFWVSVAEGVAEGENWELTAFGEERQRDLIGSARDLLVAAGAPPPVAFRAGSYAADLATLRALSGHGIRFDSSHNGSHHPWPSALPLPPAQIAPVALQGVVELPVTQIEDSPGRLRHLQLCAVSSDESEAALLHAAENGHPLVTLVSHSFELATRDGMRPNRTLCRRFDRLCRFLEENSDRLPTTHISELGDLPPDVEARPLRASRVRTARRMAEQLWSNLRYERTL